MKIYDYAFVDLEKINTVSNLQKNLLSFYI